MPKQVFFTISEQIAYQIKMDIFEGRLLPGTNLREVSLAERFGVSRGPVRDALKSLAKEGFLNAVPNIGVSVAAPPSPEVLGRILQMRVSLETFSLEKVIGTFTGEDCEKFQLALAGMLRCAKEGNVREFRDYDMLFHGIIVKKYGDTHLYGIWNELVFRMMFNYDRLATLKLAVQEHQAIFEAIEKRDIERAIILLGDNIR